MIIPQLPFERREDKVVLTAPVLLTCGCFSGDTKINCSTGKAPYKNRTIKQLYEMWSSGWWEKHKGDLTVRGLQKERVGRNKVLDVVYMGKKNVIELSFADGTTIKCTPDHKFYTLNGWVEAKDMLGESGLKDPVNIKHGYKQKKVSDPRICVPDIHPYARKQTKLNGSTSNVMELHRAMFECYANGFSSLDEWKENMTKDSLFFDPNKFVVHHIDGDHRNNAKDNLCLLSDVAHKKLHALQEKEHGLAVPQPVECISIEEKGAEDVYDISCETFNSYTANGFVVHNCGSVTARWANIQQNLSTRIAQGKPKSSKIISDWIKQEGLDTKWPVLKLHTFGIVVAVTDKGPEMVNIMSGAPTKVAEEISALIKRSINV